MFARSKVESLGARLQLKPLACKRLYTGWSRQKAVAAMVVMAVSSGGGGLPWPLLFPGVQASDTAPVGCSASTCASLEWVEGGQYSDGGVFGSDAICAESDTRPILGCSGEVDFQTAVDFCEGIGAR
jgi:hypothetical protein